MDGLDAQTLFGSQPTGYTYEDISMLPGIPADLLNFKLDGNVATPVLSKEGQDAGEVDDDMATPVVVLSKEGQDAGEVLKV
jgi:hypothetical protein